MRTRILFLALLCIASVAAAAEIRGTWSIVANGDRLQLSISRDHSNWSDSVGRTEVPLSDSQMNSAAETPVRFAFKRDAGTIDFTGTFQNGEGVGRFVFTPNASYASTLQSIGVTSEDPIDDEALFRLAMHDVSLAFIRDMASLGYRENLESYIRFRIHGVTPDFVRELRSLGIDKLAAEDLVRFRIHGVSPQFVRDMKDLGFTASAEDLVRFRIHGVSSDFVRAMRDLGVRDLSNETLVRMRIHGVSSDYVRDLRDLGYNSLSADDLVQMRIHDVSIDFIRSLANAGYHGIPPGKLVQMRIRGMDASMLRGSNR